MLKSRSVKNITNIIVVADEQSGAVGMFAVCVSPDFVVQINNFFSLVLFPVVIYKRRGKKLISKTVKYKLDSSSKMKFAFFYL